MGCVLAPCLFPPCCGNPCWLSACTCGCCCTRLSVPCGLSRRDDLVWLPLSGCCRGGVPCLGSVPALYLRAGGGGGGDGGLTDGAPSSSTRALHAVAAESRRERSGGRGRLTLVYAHGNMMNLEHSAYVASRLQASVSVPVDVLCITYPGYSCDSLLCPTTETLCIAAVAAGHRYLTQECGVPRNEIVFWGHSLGSGPTVQVAARVPDARGTMLQSPFLSALSTTAFAGPEGAQSSCLWRCLDSFKSYEAVPRIEHPVLVLHGTVRCAALRGESSWPGS